MYLNKIRFKPSYLNTIKKILSKNWHSVTDLGVINCYYMYAYANNPTSNWKGTNYRCYLQCAFLWQSAEYQYRQAYWIMGWSNWSSEEMTIIQILTDISMLKRLAIGISWQQTTRLHLSSPKNSCYYLKRYAETHRNVLSVQLTRLLYRNIRPSNQDVAIVNSHFL